MQFNTCWLSLSSDPHFLLFTIITTSAINVYDWRCGTGGGVPGAWTISAAPCSFIRHTGYTIISFMVRDVMKIGKRVQTCCLLTVVALCSCLYAQRIGKLYFASGSGINDCASCQWWKEVGSTTWGCGWECLPFATTNVWSNNALSWLFVSCTELESKVGAVYTRGKRRLRNYWIVHLFWKQKWWGCTRSNYCNAWLWVICLPLLQWL